MSTVAGTAEADGGYPVLVIDDHELFSATLTMALCREGFDARALPVASVMDFLARPSSRATGLVVLDLHLRQGPDGPDVDGASLVSDLRERRWKVLVVSGSSDRSGVARAVAAGAIGFVSKSQSFETLLYTVTAATEDRSVMSESERRRWLARNDRHRGEERELARRFSRLSPREREVLDLLAAGMRASTIAEHFVVSLPTVRTQIRSILRKLETGSQLEAVALLRR